MSLAAADARLFSMELLNVVSLLLDGEWLELRCPINNRLRWWEYVRATFEFLWLPCTCERAAACETFHRIHN